MSEQTSENVLDPQFLIDPDGDLIPRKQVSSIVIQKVGFIFQRHEVKLTYADRVGEWTYSCKKRKKAKKVRDSLIKSLCYNTPPPPKTPTL